MNRDKKLRLSIWIKQTNKQNKQTNRNNNTSSRKQIELNASNKIFILFDSGSGGKQSKYENGFEVYKLDWIIYVHFHQGTPGSVNSIFKSHQILVMMLKVLGR